jgi:hypothetical protein
LAHLQENNMSAVPKESPPAAPVEAPAHLEALIDQALHETFPASDPISPSIRESDATRRVSTHAGPIERRARWSARVARTAPSLIGFGAFAVALSLMRAARRR